MTEADRERCAQVCDDKERYWATLRNSERIYRGREWMVFDRCSEACEECARTIRALPLEPEPKRGEDDADERERKMRRLGITQEDIAMSMPPEPGH